MQITLNETELMEALENYVRSQITISDDQDIKIELRAGRGENGFTATLDIVSSKAKPVKKVTRAFADKATSPVGPSDSGPIEFTSEDEDSNEGETFTVDAKGNPVVFDSEMEETVPEPTVTTRPDSIFKKVS